MIAPSQFVKDKFVQHGWRGSRIHVLPHFQELPSNVEPHPGRNGHILYFGRLSPEKGVGDVIAAMAHLPQMHFVIAGDGPQRNELESLAASLGSRNVSFAGQISGGALEGLIARSQFTVFPSRAYETFGKSILESYAHARAVVASDLGSRRELVEHGKTGLLYPAGNVNELAAAFQFLHERSDLAAEMGGAGWRRARDKYSPVQHFLELQSLYEQVVDSSQKGMSAARPLRVAFVGGRGVAAKYSGVESYYEATGARLAAKGHRITAYCRSYFTPKVSEHNGMRVVRLPTVRTKHLDTLLHTALSTVHASFGNCDIVHYQTLGPALFSLIPRCFGKKTLVTVQGLDWQRSKWSWFARQALKAGEWAAAHFPDRTIVVSRTLQSHFRIQHEKETDYVPNGSVFRNRRGSESLRDFRAYAAKVHTFVGETLAGEKLSPVN